MRGGTSAVHRGTGLLWLLTFLVPMFSGCLVEYPDGSRLPELEVGDGDVYVYRLDGSDRTLRFEIGPELWIHIPRDIFRFGSTRPFLVEGPGAGADGTVLFTFTDHSGASLYRTARCAFDRSCPVGEPVPFELVPVVSGPLFSAAIITEIEARQDGTFATTDPLLHHEWRWRLHGAENEVWRLEPIEATAPPPDASDVFGCDVRYHTITFHRDDLLPLTCETEEGVWRLVDRSFGRGAWRTNLYPPSWLNRDVEQGEEQSPLIQGTSALGPSALTLERAVERLSADEAFQAIEGSSDPWALWSVELTEDAEACAGEEGCGGRSAWRFVVAKGDRTSTTFDVIHQPPAATGESLPLIGENASGPTVVVETSTGPSVPAFDRTMQTSGRMAPMGALLELAPCAPVEREGEYERSECAFVLTARVREGAVGYTYTFIEQDGTAWPYEPQLRQWQVMQVSADTVNAMAGP